MKQIKFVCLAFSVVCLLFILLGCDDTNEARDKYGMQRIDESVYEIENIRDVTIKNDVIYFAVGNTIYATDCHNTENNDIFTYRDTILQTSSEIMAIFADEESIWYACLDGNIENYNFESHSIEKYSLFEDNSNITYLTANQGTVLMIQEVLGELYRETKIYLYNIAAEELHELTDELLPSGYYQSAGFVDDQKLYFILNNIPSSDFTTFIICDEKKIYTNKKIEGPFYNGEYNDIWNTLYYVRAGSIYKYDINKDSSSIIGAVQENLINKIFVTTENFIAFNRYNGTLEVTLIPKAEDTLRVLIPDMFGIEYMLNEIAVQYKLEYGKNLEIVPIAEQGYLDHIRLLLLNKDSSFDLFFVPDGRDEMFLKTLIEYHLYTPLNQLPKTNLFFDTDCYLYFKSSISDTSGDIIGLPFDSSALFLTLGKKYETGYEIDNDALFTYDAIYLWENQILHDNDTALFWDEATGRLLLEHLLTQLIDQNLPETSKSEIERYLQFLVNLKQNNKLTGNNNILDAVNLFSSLSKPMDLSHFKLSTFPSYNATGGGVVRCVNKNFIICSPYSERIEYVDMFMSCMIENYLYDANYFNGLIGRSLDRYTNALYEPSFEMVDLIPYIDLDLKYQNGYTALYQFGEFEDLYYQVLDGNMDVDQATDTIYNTLKKWVYE